MEGDGEDANDEEGGYVTLASSSCNFSSHDDIVTEFCSHEKVLLYERRHDSCFCLINPSSP